MDSADFMRRGDMGPAICPNISSHTRLRSRITLYQPIALALITADLLFVSFVSFASFVFVFVVLISFIASFSLMLGYGGLKVGKACPDVGRIDRRRA